MNHAKSQTTMEFVLLISAVLLFALIVLFAVADYALQSGERIITSQLSEIGAQITDESREIFYLGIFSQEIMSVNFPDGVKSVFTKNFNKVSGPDENYLIITYQSGGLLVNMTFPAEVPLLTANCTEVADCFPNVNCTTCHLSPLDYSIGRKDLRLECIAWEGGYAVNITRVYI